MATLQSLNISTTDYIRLPAGTSDQRPGDVIKYFTSPGTTTWTSPITGNIQVLVVAGGGGGGGHGPGGSFHGAGAGGGAGGVVYASSFPVVSGTNYTVTVGVGGIGGDVANGVIPSPGNPSVFGTITANGGGRGATGNAPGSYAAANGGSGGGGSRENATAGTATQSPSGGGTGYGNAGGSSPGGGGSGGGGGGAGGAGAAGGSANGNGGAGLSFNITGQPYWVGGGGGGGQGGNPGRSPYFGIGGSGGGGPGRAADEHTPGIPGATNTGGGGGGAGANVGPSAGNTYNYSLSGNDPQHRGGQGGPGVVIIRYTPPNVITPVTGMIRFNTDGNYEEVYDGTKWRPSTTTVVSFTTQGQHTWRVPEGVNTAWVLVIGGGGAGGATVIGSNGGGGGAGGMVEHTAYQVMPGGSVPIFVGDGGVATPINFNGPGIPGQPSWFSALHGFGGGGGSGYPHRRGYPDSSYGIGEQGGSSGGSELVNTVASATQNSPSGATGYGNNGGQGVPGAVYNGGGGGGAGAAGQNGSPTKGGDGGAGRASSITGTSVTYAGGGGSGTYSPTPSTTNPGGAGGSGGGGAGGSTNGDSGLDGQPQTGSGGGGRGTHFRNFGRGGGGGSGIVIVRY
jgi:hypothetical protein